MNQSETEAIAKAIAALENAKQTLDDESLSLNRNLDHIEAHINAALTALQEQPAPCVYTELNDLCDELGCLPGTNRVSFLRERLSALQPSPAREEATEIVGMKSIIAHLQQDHEFAVLRATAAEAMVREKDSSIAKLVDDLVWYEERNTGLVTQAEILKARATTAEARVKELEQELMNRDAFSEEYFDRATAAEARVKELEGELDTIVRGRYDGLEVTHYSADECRNIARAALRR